MGIAPLALRSQAVAGVPVRALSFAGDIDRKPGFSDCRVMVDPARREAIDDFLGMLSPLDRNIIRLRSMEDAPETGNFLEGIRNDWGEESLPSSVSSAGCSGTAVRGRHTLRSARPPCGPVGRPARH